METGNRITTKNRKKRREPTLEELAARQRQELKRLEARHQRQRKDLVGEDSAEARIVYQTVSAMQGESQNSLLSASTPLPDAEPQKQKLEFNLVRKGLHYAEQDGEFFCREIMDIQIDFDRENGHRIEAMIASLLVKMKDKVRGIYDRGDPRIQVGIDVIDQIAESAKSLKPLNRILTLLDDDIYYYHPELMRTNTKIWMWSEFRQEFANRCLANYLPLPLLEATNGGADIHFASSPDSFALMFDSKSPDEENTRYMITNKEAVKIDKAFGYKYMDINPATGKPFLRFRYADYGQRGFFDGERVMSIPEFYTCAPSVDFAGNDYKVNSSGYSIVNGYLYDQIDEKIKIDPEKKKEPLGFIDELLGNDPDQNRNTRNSAVMLDFFRQSQESMKKLSISADHAITIEGKTYLPKGFFKPSKKTLGENGYVDYRQSEYVKI